MADAIAVAKQFQSILGRAPTGPEAEYFAKFLDEGSIQPHEIGQILQSTPEFQTTQLQSNARQFGEQLNEQNAGILGQAGAEANSRFAGLGRQNTSAIGSSIMQAGGQLAQQRQSALASFYGQGLQQNQGLYQQGGQGALERAYGFRDEARQRRYQLEDRNYMANMYADLAGRQSKSQKSQALGGMAMGLAGAGLGAYAGSFAGPGGAMAGAKLGAGLGQGAGGLF